MRSDSCVPSVASDRRSSDKSDRAARLYTQKGRFFLCFRAVCSQSNQHIWDNRLYHFYWYITITRYLGPMRCGFTNIINNQRVFLLMT